MFEIGVPILKKLEKLINWVEDIKEKIRVVLRRYIY